MKLYQVLTNAAPKSSGGAVLSQKIRDGILFGSGRQAMAVMDKHYNFQRSLLAHRASTGILAMSLDSIKGLEKYVVQFRRFLGHMTNGGEPMADGFALELLKKQPRKCDELQATLAQFATRPTHARTVDALLASSRS